MWQFLLAAAVAGSGFFARRLISNGDPVTGCVSVRTEKFVEEESVVETQKEIEGESFDPVKPQVSISPLSVSSLIPSESCEIYDSGSSQRLNSMVGEEGFFRFSSLGTGDGSGFRSGSRKKAGLRGNVDGVKRRVEVDKLEKKSGFMDGDEVVVEEQKKKGRKFSVCLKRRRTSKTILGKCGSCSSKGSSFFNWGLGVGIMYIVSAGKAEIDKLNAAIDETSEVVSDLKSELYKRKLSHDLRDSSCKSRVDRCLKETMGKDKQSLLTESGAEGANPDDTKVLGLPLTDDGECASSVLTEEPEPEVLEVDQLEAELESELQKISWCTSEEASGHKGRITNLGELDPEHLLDVANTDLSANVPQVPHKLVGTDSNSFQFHGVSPSELDRKLCHLLIDQQESHIVELESNLHSVQTKLHEKEAELQALKDCVRHLTDFSLETASDEETEEAKAAIAEQERNNDVDSLMSATSLADSANKKLPTRQKPVVGMKRVMEFESCDCCVNNAVISDCSWGSMLMSRR